MGTRWFGWTAALVLAAGVGRALAWELPLTVDEYGGKSGARHVTTGVPLLVGQAQETADLRLAEKDARGRLVAVPAQFRVLARWWRDDNSIRWVLVDFTTSVEPKGTRTYYLTDAKMEAPTINQPRFRSARK